MGPDRTTCWAITWIAPPADQSITSFKKSLLLPPLQVFWASSGYRSRTRDYLHLPNGRTIEHRSNRTLITSNIEHRTSNTSNIEYIEHRSNQTRPTVRPPTVRTQPTNELTNQIKSSKRQNKVSPRRQLDPSLDPSWPVKILKITTSTKLKVNLILNQPSN